MNEHKVSPNEFANDPQTHLARLRVRDNYFYEKNGKQIVGSKIISHEVNMELYATEALLKEQDEPNSFRNLNNIEANSYEQSELKVEFKNFSSDIGGNLTLKEIVGEKKF